MRRRADSRLGCLSRTGKLTITDAATSPTTAFQYGLRRPVLDFVINGSTPTVDLRVDIVNSAGDVVRSRFLTGVPTGSTQKIGWSGANYFMSVLGKPSERTPWMLQIGGHQRRHMQPPEAHGGRDR